MNHLFSILVLALFFVPNLVEGQISLRPQVGINAPSLYKEIANQEWKGHVGFQFGADLLIGGDVFFQPGINYESSSLTLDGVGDLDISRINIPVYVGFRLFEHENKSFGLRAFVGPNFALNVNEKLDDAITDISEDNIKGSQISGVVGAGLDLSILFVDVGYRFGLTKIFEDINDDDAKKHFFIANAGIRIGF